MFRNIKNAIALRFATTDKNTALLMAEGAFASMVINLTNPFYQLFARQMGAGDYAIGFINSLPALCALFVLLPVSYYIDTVADKKRFVSKTILACGAVFPIIACAPFLGQTGIWFFIIGVSLFNVPFILYTVSWQSYFSDMYTPRQRGVPYAMRIAVTNFIPAVTVLVCGGLIGSFCPTPQLKIIAYQSFFVMAFVSALAQKKAFDHTICANPPPPMPKRSAKQLVSTFSQSFRELKKNPQYALFLGLLLFFYISWQMAWPLFFINLMDYQHFTPMMKCMSDVVSFLTLSMTATWWGKRIQKTGVHKSTIFGLFCCASSPIWIVTFGGPTMVYLNYAFNGFAAPAFQLGLFNDMLDLIPDENKTLNIGIYNTVLQLSGFLAPLIGVSIYKLWGMTNTMRLSSCLRLIAATLFLIRYLILKKKKAAQLVQE